VSLQSQLYRMLSIHSSIQECAILSSRSDPLIMVCHVSSTLPIRSLHPPYSVPIHIDKHLKPVTSLAAMVLAQSQTSHSGPTLLFGLDSACALWSIALRPKEVQRNEGSDDGFAIRATNHRKHLDLKVSWSTDVKGLLRGAGREDDVPEKARTRYRKVDYRWAWLSAFSRRDLTRAELMTSI